MTTEERLECLEKEAQRNRKVIRWFGVLLGLCIGAWLATGVFFPQGLIAQDVTDLIRAKQFYMVDERGMPRIVMLVHEGEPILNLLDEATSPRFAIALHEGEPSMAMYDEMLNIIWSAP